jgi:hypothetical protein
MASDGVDDTLRDRLSHRSPSGRGQDACKAQPRFLEPVDCGSCAGTVEISV